MSNSSKTRTP